MVIHQGGPYFKFVIFSAYPLKKDLITKKKKLYKKVLVQLINFNLCTKALNLQK